MSRKIAVVLASEVPQLSSSRARMTILLLLSPNDSPNHQYDEGTKRGDADRPKIELTAIDLPPPELHPDQTADERPDDAEDDREDAAGRIAAGHEKLGE